MIDFGLWLTSKETGEISEKTLGIQFASFLLAVFQAQAVNQQSILTGLNGSQIK